MKKVSELQKMSGSELQKELVELLREQFNMRMQRATGQLTKPHLMKRVRRDIACVKTLLTEKAKMGGEND